MFKGPIKTTSINKVITLKKFKIFNFFFLISFLNQSVKNGKRGVFFRLYEWRFTSFLRQYFYKFTQFYFRYYYYKLEIFQILEIKPQNVLLNILLFEFGLFFKKTFFFIVKKHKTYINHKKKFFDSISYFFLQTPDQKHYINKYLKILFLKKYFSSKISRLYFFNLLNPKISTFGLIYKTMIFDLIWKQL